MNKRIWLVVALAALGGVGCSASDDGGDIALTWTILVNGQASTCASVGAETLEVISTRSSGKQYRDLFDCADMSGRTAEVPAGIYDVEINLLDGNDNPLNLVDVIEPDVEVRSNQTTSLGNFPFGFSFGTITFRVHMGSAAVTGGNCNPTNPNNGAGVALEEISVVRASTSQCILLNITGVTDMNNAPVVEQTCDPFLCQLETTVHTITGLNDGQYLIGVFGRKGATSAQNAPICYVSDEMPFTINGGNTVNLGTIFAPFDTQFDTQNLCNATKPRA